MALKSYFEEYAQEVWEKNWMNPEMQTTLLNTYPPTLIATILKALREPLKESDQVQPVEEIAGPVSEIPLEYDHARSEEIDWVHSEGVYEMFQCKSAEMRA